MAASDPDRAAAERDINTEAIIFALTAIADAVNDLAQLLAEREAHR